ncbi:MAG TPA: PqqD family protein [Terriglobales bacterium]|nr:PqqD family protein [Terriglobales bacterium]
MSVSKPLYIGTSKSIAARMLGGEMMIMSMRDSTFFTLNEVASAIWRAADGSTPLSDIVSGTICREFNVEFETAYRDAGELVQRLAEHGIVVLSDHPITAGPESSNAQ